MCRCTTAPYFADGGERIARGEDGETYYMPDDMKYKEWKERFVDGGNNMSLDKPNDVNTVDYLVKKADKKYNIKNDKVEINKAFNMLPEAHMHELEEYLSEINLGVDGNSHYNRETKTLFLAKGADAQEIVHEFAHAYETKIDLYNNDKFLKMLNDNFGDIDPLLDIVIDDVTFEGSSVKLVAYSKNMSKFISDYQRRIYEELSENENLIDYNTFKLNVRSLGEYFSEGYREYFFNPENLRSKDHKLYLLIKDLVS